MCLLSNAIRSVVGSSVQGVTIVQSHHKSFTNHVKEEIIHENDKIQSSKEKENKEFYISILKPADFIRSKYLTSVQPASLGMCVRH